MENRIKREYCLRSADFDSMCRLKPSAVLDLFQDIAGVHAEELGIGFEALWEKGLIWVLVRTKYEQYQSPARFEKVTSESWPLPPSRAGFTREYLIKNAKGEIVIKGTSDWVILDSISRKIVPAATVYSIEKFCEEKNFEGRTKKLPDFEGEEKLSLTAGYSLTDLNGHVNNTKYADFVLDCDNLPRDAEIAAFQIDYRKEVLSGERLTLSCRENGKELLYKGYDSEGNISFSCKIDIK